MSETFQNMGILLIVVVPAITMRLFAQEWSAGTMELLATLPLRPWQVVLGKFLGAATILALMTMGTVVDLVPLYLYARPDTILIASGYLGFVLLGTACLAVGQLFSALTENQIIAALVTVAVLLALWFVGNLARFQTDPSMHLLLAHLSFSDQFGEFVRGLVRTEAVAYFLVVTGAALTLNAGYLDWRR
jgi:ABC-2 type transport system permease protein